MALFGDFSGTAELSDFLCPFIVGVCPWTSRHGLRLHLPPAGTGPPGSRARCFRTCPGSVTARDPSASCDSDASGVAFRTLRRRRHPEVALFRGSIPCLHVPLSTLRHPPHGVHRMTRGQCGSLALHRMALSSTTPCRFIPALRRPALRKKSQPAMKQTPSDSLGAYFRSSASARLPRPPAAPNL